MNEWHAPSLADMPRISLHPTCQYDSLQSYAMYNQAHGDVNIVRNHEHHLVLSYQWLEAYNVQTSGSIGSAEKKMIILFSML